jgi:uncharacterized protein
MVRSALAETMFIDTGAFIARYDQDDQHHHQAQALWARLAPTAGRWRLVTSGGVLTETFTLLGRRTNFPYAARIARQILESPSFTFCWQDPDIASTALIWFAKFADQSVSWVDCESFAYMKARRITRVFTFDRHFEDAGFRRFPG